MTTVRAPDRDAVAEEGRPVRAPVALLGTAAAPAAVAAATGGLAVASAALTVFGHAVGLLTRSVPLALTLTLGWVLPGEALLEGTSPHADRWLPGTLLHAITLG